LSVEPAYVNGFVDGGDLVLLYRDPNGELLARRRPAEWSNFFRRQDVSAETMRELRNSEWVQGIVEEADWLRVKWTDRAWRYYVHMQEVTVPGEQHRETVPGYIASLGIPSFEADVSPERRYFSETGAKVAQPRRCYVDIETDSRVPAAVARKGKARILAWSVSVDERPELDYRDPEGIRILASAVLEEDSNDAERRLLESFWRTIEPYDQLAAWFGDGFDFPILKYRADLVGARHKDFRRWLYVDQMVAHERMNRNAAESGAEKESLALQFVAQELLGEGKKEFNVRQTWEAWEAGGEERERLLWYCEQDTILLPKIERKTGYLALNATLCEIARCFQETRNIFPIPIIDGFLLRMGVERKLRFPSKRGEEGPHRQFAGAFVLEPKAKGIRRNVHVFDFSGMYPSIMLTWNMSPETRAPDVFPSGPISEGCCRTPSTRAGFRNSPKGIVPEALLLVRKERKFWQKKQAELPPGTPEWVDAGRRSNAYKVAANVFYGGTGSPHCRFYDRTVAEGTSQTGAWLIQRTLNEAEKRGMFALYGDTDSGLVEGATREQVAEFVRWCNAELYPKLVAECGCAENFIDLAYEKEFERLVIVSKKRYFGTFRGYKWTTTCSCDNENGEPGSLDIRTMTCRDCGRKWDELPLPRGKPEIKGLEYKRGDALLLARRLQFQIIDKFCSGRCEDPAEYVPLVQEMRRHVLEDELPIEEVRLSQSISKSLKEYATKTKKDGTQTADLAHVQVAKILKERGELIEEGTRIEYYVVDASESPMKVAPAVDYDGKPDRYYVWEQRVYPATKTVLEATFPAAPGMSADELLVRDWDRFLKVRPKISPAPGPESRPKVRKGAIGQASLFDLPVPSAQPKS
jgi:DNA polymerase elongation subunit (family B)